MKKILFGFVLLLQIGFCGVSFADASEVNLVNGGAIDLSNGEKITPKENGAVSNVKPPKYTVHIDSFEKGGEDITGEDGIDLITKYIAFFYKAIAGIIGLICVLIVAVSGVQISLGGLSPEGVNQAKDRIIQALLSMALLFSSAAILKAINGGFFT